MDELPADDFDRLVDTIETNAQRGSDIVRQLLAFGRGLEGERVVVQPRHIIKEMVKIARETFPKNLTVTADVPEQLWPILGDPTHLHQVLLNLCINARDAMPDGGTVTIDIANHAVAPGDKGFGELPPGDYVAVTIADEGTGMSPEVLSRVTEPFFTTKDQGKGTGLGLSMVYGFMKQSGGALRLESEEGRGTTVTMLFPCENARADPRAPAPTSALPDKRGNETVLVVEDQADIGDYAEAVLTEFGYTVLRADHADAALEVLDGATGVDLLFSDLIMPGGMNGVMLAREVKRRRPRIRVLLTTGYAESSIERVDARGAEFELIQKPYRRTDLATKVRQVIDGPSGVG